MSNTAEQLLSNVESIRDTLDLLVGIVNGSHEVDADTWATLMEHGADLGELDPDEDGDDIDDDEAQQEAMRLLEDMPLSVEVLGKRSLGDDEWKVSHLEVTFCTGGPHIELDTGRGQIVGYWGGDTIYRGVSSDVVAYFDQLADL